MGNMSLWLEIVITEHAFVGQEEYGNLSFFQLCYESETVLKILFMIEKRERCISLKADFFSQVSSQSRPCFSVYFCVVGNIGLMVVVFQ